MKINEANSRDAAFVAGALVPMAATTHGSGVSSVKRMRDDQDATTGFSAWSPPE